MKKALLSLLLVVTSAAYAGDIFNKEQTWDMDRGPKTIKVTHIAVSNVQESCEKESRRRNKGGFNFSVRACTFWEGNECTIITAKKETHHTLGHEFYHCFAGGFH